VFTDAKLLLFRDICKYFYKIYVIYLIFLDYIPDKEYQLRFNSSFQKIFDLFAYLKKKLYLCTHK